MNCNFSPRFFERIGHHTDFLHSGVAPPLTAPGEGVDGQAGLWPGESRLVAALHRSPAFPLAPLNQWRWPSNESTTGAAM